MDAEPQCNTSADDSPADYLFIDNARFISMIAIVMRHCELSLFGSSPPPPLEDALVQFRTFGVQLFFVNSAFLMSDWLTRRDSGPRGYWNSRVAQLVLPWLIWVVIYSAIDLLKLLAGYDRRTVEIPGRILHNMFETSYWFVPILFVSLAIMLPLRRYWHSWWFGLALLCLSLIYGVNQYGRWFPSGHSIAFFGYLFPIWFGMQLFQHFRAVVTWVNSVPRWLMLVVFSVTFGLTIAEDRIMETLGFPNDYNALQISNQLYSLVVLSVLIRLPVRVVPSFIDVRKESYGIYLTHEVVAVVGRGAINFASGRPASGESLFVRLPQLVQDPLARIGLWVLWSAVVYIASLLVTKALRGTPLAWTVGIKERGKPSGDPG